MFDGVRAVAQPGDRRDRPLDAAKIVLIAVKRGPEVAGRLSAVIDAYKARFQQQSVGLITRDSCAAF